MVGRVTLVQGNLLEEMECMAPVQFTQGNHITALGPCKIFHVDVAG